MKNYLKISLLYLSIFLSFLFFPRDTLSQSLHWEKYQNNPVLQSDNSENWDGKNRLMPTVIFDEGIYKMWFIGSDGTTQQLGYATSNDGLVWNVSTHNPVLAPLALEEFSISENSIIRDGNLYKVWFTVLNSNGYEIKYANSNDGIKWFRQDLFELNTQKWESNKNMFSPTVVKKGSKYIMLYNAVQDDHWKIGYASSNDGITWNKNPNPVIEATEEWEGSHTGRPWLIYHSDLDTYEVFYHASDPTVIGHAFSFDALSWDKKNIENPILFNGPSLFDSIKINAPSVVIDPDNNKILHMWYGGFNGTQWSIGYATTGEFPSKLNPVVLIPGMFASWNSKAILGNDDVPQSDWIMTPFVNDYDGIVNTLISAGYKNNPLESGQNLFVFNYDWRKPVEETASQLNNYLQEYVLPKNKDKQVYLIGHSLGGLVGRTYLQNYDNNHILKLFTLGTPHSGAIQAYKAWEGGVVDNNNLWEKLALEIILGINRNGSWTNKDVVREIAPVVHDLLPTFDYLKDTNNQTIPVTSLKTQNQNLWLTNLDSNFSDYFDRFYSIYGETGQTPEWYKVTSNNPLENALGLWQDGKPTDIINSTLGDEVVLTKSATRNSASSSLLKDINHRSLVSEETAISELVDKLGVKPTAIITPSPSQPIFPSLFFALKSPATFKVTGPSGNFESDSNKIVFIPNAAEGNYQINVKGLNSGKYNLLIGELGLTNSTWKEISDNTNTDELDTYTIFYDPQNPPEEPVVDQNGRFYLTNAYNNLEDLKVKYPHWTLLLASHALTNAQQQFEKNKFDNSANFILQAINHLFVFRKRQTLPDPLNNTFSIIKDLSIAYEKVLSQTKTKISSKQIEAQLTGVEIFKKMAFEKLKLKGKEQNTQSYLLGEKLLESAKVSFAKGNLLQTQIETYLARFLLLEV